MSKSESGVSNKAVIDNKKLATVLVEYLSDHLMDDSLGANIGEGL